MPMSPFATAVSSPRTSLFWKSAGKVATRSGGTTTTGVTPVVSHLVARGSVHGVGPYVTGFTPLVTYPITSRGDVESVSVSTGITPSVTWTVSNP